MKLERQCNTTVNPYREIRAAWSKWSGLLSSTGFCPLAQRQKLSMVLPAWELITSPSYKSELWWWLLVKFLFSEIKEFRLNSLIQHSVKNVTIIRTIRKGQWSVSFQIMCQVVLSLSHWKMDSEIIGIYIKTIYRPCSIQSGIEMD